MTKKMSRKERTIIACEFLKEKWSADALVDTIYPLISDDDIDGYIRELVELGYKFFEKIDKVARKYEMPRDHARMVVTSPAVEHFAEAMLKVAEEDEGESEGGLN